MYIYFNYILLYDGSIFIGKLNIKNKELILFHFTIY